MIADLNWINRSQQVELKLDFLQVFEIFYSFEVCQFLKSQL